jgi:hypothetical protein
MKSQYHAHRSERVNYTLMWVTAWLKVITQPNPVEYTAQLFTMVVFIMKFCIW